MTPHNPSSWDHCLNRFGVPRYLAVLSRVFTARCMLWYMAENYRVRGSIVVPP